MPGCLIVLVDESAAMETPMPRPSDAPPTSEAPKSKATSFATVLNAALARWSSHAEMDIALVGYSSASPDEPRIRSCWAGTLAGRDFVPAKELLSAPLAIEERTRRTPDAYGMMQETSVSFAV
jgi:hypothetical protein